jgi:hypothetical protein
MEQKKIISGQLLKDVSSSHIPEGSYGDARNIIVSDPTSGDYSRVEKIVGSKNVSYSLGYTITKILGGCNDDKNSILYFFAEASTGNKIISIDDSDTVTTVIDYDFGWISTTKLLNIYFLQDSLIWIDDSDEIKRLPLGVYPVSPSAGSLGVEEISLAKKPPLTQPYCMMWNDDNIDVQERESDYQFATYFEYADGGKSVLSPYSRPLVRKTRNFNRFYIYPDIPVSESESGVTTPPSIKRWAEYDSFPDNAIRIVVCARNIRTQTFYEIGSLDRVKDGSNDNGYGKYDKEFIEFTAPLGGLAVPQQQMVQQYFVPKDPKALSIAGNRILAGNFREGEDQLDIEMSVAQSSTAYTLSGPNSLWDINKMDYFQIDYDAVNDVYVKTKQTESIYTIYAVIKKDGYWDTDFDPLTYTPGDVINIVGATPIDLSGIGVKGTDDPYYRYISDPKGKVQNVRTSLDADQFIDVDTDATYGDIIEAGLPYEDEGGTMFPSAGSYKMALVASDAFGRKSDVIHKNEWSVKFNEKEYSRLTSINYALQLDMKDREWIRSVEVLITGNVETDTFAEGTTDGAGFRKVDADDIVTWEPTYANGDQSLGISLEGFFREGGKYTFEEGDTISLFKVRNDALTITFDIIKAPILGVEGKYILINAEDYSGDSTIDSTTSIPFVIRSPRVTESSTIFYGTGVSHPVEAGTTGTFAVNGFMSGDSFVKIGYGYVATWDTTDGHQAYKTGTEILEKSISLDEDGGWIYGKGKAFIESSFGEVNKENYVRFGGQIINDTKINGLGDFLALDEVTTDVEFGEINKLQLVGDDQGQGTVVLAMCPLRVSSIYVGSTVLSNADGTTSMIKSEGFIGMVRPQSKEYGTIHPESVLSVKGKVFFYDYINSCFVMYASNGLHEISTNGLDQFFRESPLKTSEVRCGYYDTYEMLLVTIKDGYNSFTDTIGYDTNNKQWRSFYDLVPDVYTRMNDVMYVSKDGLIGKCRKVAADDTTYSNWFGVQYDSTIKVPFNLDPSTRKYWGVVALNIKPDAFQWNADGELEFIDQQFKIMISNEDGQYSDVIDGEFEIENGIVYATIGLDQNSPGGATDGEELMSKEIEVSIVMGSGTQIQIGEMSAGFTPVSGQNIP